MPDINVAAGEVSSGRFSLVAGQVSTVTFADDVRAVQITSDGSAIIYYTVDGRPPRRRQQEDVRDPRTAATHHRRQVGALHATKRRARPSQAHQHRHTRCPCRAGRLMGLKFTVGSVAAAGMSELMARLQMAETKADAADAAAAQAKTDAAAAQAVGVNARQMVLNRDPQLTTLSTQQATLSTQQASLESLAATLGAAIPASEVTHAQQWAAINAVQAAVAAIKVPDLTALINRVSALEGKAITKQEKRVATTTLLALGATTDLTVTWTTPFPDANYLVIPLLDASTGIANVNPPAVKSQTKDGCVVSVRANVAVAAGLAVNVVGLRFG